MAFARLILFNIDAIDSLKCVKWCRHLIVGIFFSSSFSFCFFFFLVSVCMCDGVVYIVAFVHVIRVLINILFGIY